MCVLMNNFIVTAKQIIAVFSVVLVWSFSFSYSCS